MAGVKNQTDFEMVKERVQRIVAKAIEDLRAGRVSLKELEYPVKLHEDPAEKMREPVLHQPYQCAFQLIDSGKSVQRGDIVNFVKVKPFVYRGRTFTVKPTELLRDFQEVNVGDYVRNLRTGLNQTFKPMNLKFEEDAEKKSTLSDFI